MSNQTHTPGPWHCWSNEDWRAAGDLQPSSICHVGDFTIVTDYRSYDFHGSDKDDARLIAAAPELLAELKQCALEAEEAPNLIFHNFPKTEELFLKASKRTLALIAKAEGR